uniref:Glutathione transferase n=1 Tax=Globodera pallida TaxID=36090 RepID=A0A183BZH6_GLOPA
MAKFKVKYLNLRGRAESIRLLLNYVQQPYEDSRENFLEFANYRDKLPLAHLPKLVVDNKFELCYSSVILQYLGEKFGLENETAEEKAICAMLAQRINDHFEYLKPYVNCLLGLIPANNVKAKGTKCHPQNPLKLPSLAERCLRPCITEDFGPVFERHLEANNTGGHLPNLAFFGMFPFEGYLVGDKLTWVDFFAASFADLALTFGRFDILDRFPRVLHHCRAVYSLPQLQQHIKNRPDTLF